MVCDVLVADTPSVLRTDIYAMAALVVVIGNLIDLPPTVTTKIGAPLCLGFGT